MKDIYFWRQMFVLSAALLYSVCIGFMLGYPAVLTAAIVNKNSTDLTTTSDHASWIVASNGIAGILGSFIVSPILQYWGRKATHIFINTCMLMGWITFSLAANITTLYAARMIQGLSVGGIYINSIIMSEYLSPKRRGYCITLKKVMTAIGILWCHAMEPFLTWRQIPITAAVIGIISIIMTLFWPESPSFLALKGKFAECEKSFIWLNGDSVESRKELKSLIDSQSNIRNTRNKSALTRLKKEFSKIDLLKSIFIVSVLTLAVDLCGRYYFVAYIIEIMITLLNNKSWAFYFTIGADLMTLIALIISTVIITYVNRRSLLYSTGILSVSLMLLISLLVYLNSVYKLSLAFQWVTATLIILQYFIANLGIIPVSFTLISEILPLESKGVGGCLSGLVFTSFYALTLKLTPVLMKYTGLTGTYAVFGISLAVCLMLICRILPETKDKTLQEIENELKGKTRETVESNSLLNN